MDVLLYSVSTKSTMEPLMETILILMISYVVTPAPEVVPTDKDSSHPCRDTVDHVTPSSVERYKRILALPSSSNRCPRRIEPSSNSHMVVVICWVLDAKDGNVYTVVVVLEPVWGILRTNIISLVKS